MKYGPASKFSTNRPCTNVPVNCPMCPLDTKGHKKTFWKYNFIVHMVDAHLSEKNELPMLPLELMVTTHISKQEEQQMGIPLSHTDDYRNENDILDSEGIEIIEAEERSESEEEGGEDENETIYAQSQLRVDRQPRKRGLSSLSTMSSLAAQDESPMKKHQGTVI